jgi:hypothetical protein
VGHAYILGGSLAGCGPTVVDVHEDLIPHELENNIDFSKKTKPATL